jgi:hypothetical protein
MFVSVEHTDLGARYVNGDWSEISFILPLIDRFVHACGWAASAAKQSLASDTRTVAKGRIEPMHY